MCGEPREDAAIREARQVYPRVCGGTMWRLRSPVAHDGLSPRVRGNHTGDASGTVAVRSIPACAGEPSVAARSSAVARVYPRVCGGTATAGIWGLVWLGLSPRVRGNLPHTVGGDAGARSIPACAGGTCLVGATA